MIADVELERVDGERALHQTARAVGGEDRVPVRVRRGELAIAARPFEPGDGEIERAVGGEGAQRLGDQAHAAALVDVVDQAGERAGALELDGERVEVEAGRAAVDQRRQRRQARRLGVDVVTDDACARSNASAASRASWGAWSPLLPMTTCADGARPEPS